MRLLKYIDYNYSLNVKRLLLMKPLLNKVIVRPNGIKSKTDGGVHVPDSVQMTSSQGTVVAVGPGAWSPEGKRLPMSVKEGDRVLIDAKRASGANINGQQYLILHENQIAMVLEEGEQVKEDFESSSSNGEKPKKPTKLISI